MMKWIALPLIAFGLLISSPGDSKTPDSAPAPTYPGPRYDWDPAGAEILHEPINLHGCDGVQVIEWRPSAREERWTDQSTLAIRVLTAACKVATRKFHEFIKNEGLVPNEKPRAEFVQFVSLMPYRGAEGRQPRNLNDLTFRFIGRNDPALFIDGWTGHKNRIIFIRNDVLNYNGSVNRQFVTVFLHELFHAQSYYYGIYDKLPNPPVDDERLATKFTNYLGYHD